MGWNNDDRLLVRAIRERWAIPADKLPGVLNRAAEIAEGKHDATPRESTSAMKALASVEKLAMESVRLEMLIEERDELRRRLDALESSDDADGTPHATAPPRADPPAGDGPG